MLSLRPTREREGIRSLRVILDTDIGGDPDDTTALLHAVASPAVELTGMLTTDEHGGRTPEHGMGGP